jgi:hypothetical protein
MAFYFSLALEFPQRLISSADSRPQRASTRGPGDQEVKTFFVKEKESPDLLAS